MPKKKNKGAGKDIRRQINGIEESDKVNVIINKMSVGGLSKEELESMFEEFKNSLPKKLRKQINVDFKREGKEIRSRISGIDESEKVDEILNKMSRGGLSKEELESMFEEFKNSLPKKLRKQIKVDLKHRDD